MSSTHFKTDGSSSRRQSYRKVFYLLDFLYRCM